MLKISDAVNLAFHAMLFLSADKEAKQFSVIELARRMNVSDNHLSKVMQRLAKAGFVSSKRGPKGGFFLSKPAEEIRLIDIYETIEGPLMDHSCLLSRPVCDGACCLLGGLLGNVQQQVRDQLTNTTLKDVSDRLPCTPEVR